MHFVRLVGILSVVVALVHTAPAVDKRDIDLGVGADIDLDIGANIDIGLGDHDEHRYKRDLNLGVGADINLGVGADINVGHDEHRRHASTNNRVNNEKDSSVVVLVNSNNQP